MWLKYKNTIFQKFFSNFLLKKNQEKNSIVDTKKLSIYFGLFAIFFFVYIFFSYQVKIYSKTKEDNLNNFVDLKKKSNYPTSQTPRKFCCP